ncbi:polyprenol dehydrogenase isoform X2 [Parasteatoda tepidariorum]|uniref:polyprenol dehydrogenase isoform X2 n=1 Tax=Parasteatoda tepidariorum TaxID=114398 RepID=UPI00077FCB7E|nr:dehydrogenase/reductase SDR family member on chromosome X isoform X2 [Parasteatoda tepidariorum]
MMRSRCSIGEIFYLYLFSMYCLFLELLGKFWFKSGLTGKVFMRCEGRTAVVTGGTNGIGYETVKKLLGFGMNVIIASNTSAADSECCLQILRSLFPKSKAGIMFAPRKITDEGFESHLAINYYSHALLTKLLLPRLKESASPSCKTRVINVSSCLHYISEIDFSDINSISSYCPHHAYMQSKVCLMLFTLALNGYLKNSRIPVLVNCIHPGIVYTDLYKHVWWPKFVGPFLFQKPIKGAEVTVYAALSAALEAEGGKYIEDCREMKPSQYSRDPLLQTRLWNDTWKTLHPWLDEVDDVDLSKE